MKRFIGVVILFIITADFSNAQQTVGFSTPGDIQPILDYRLPDWGYSNFLLDFDFNGNGFHRENLSVPSSGRSTSLGLNPGYILFRESEERIFELRSNVIFRYNGNHQKREIPFSNEEIEDDTGNLRTVFIVNPSLKEYVSESLFLFGNAPFVINYQRVEDENKTEEVVTDKTINIDRFVSADPRIGFGFGRIRNVTPIIRAVRLKERINRISNRMTVDEEDIQNAADQFTRLEGYQRNYDRPSKYFWEDLDDRISADLSSIDTFDMLYLTDVLNEAIGNRLEGWEVITGAQFEYSDFLSRDERRSDQTEPTISRTSVIRELLGGFINTRWFKNTSLREQWGLFANVNLKYSLREENEPFSADLKRSLNIAGGVNWLYNISDRMLVQSSVTNSYFRDKLELDGGNGIADLEANNWVNNIAFSGALNYFIENRIQLNLTMTPSLTYFGNSESGNKLDSRTFNWQVGAGLRYYLQRNFY